METEASPAPAGREPPWASCGEAILSSSPHESKEQMRLQGQSSRTPAVAHGCRISGAQDNEIYFLFLLSNF